MKIGVIGSGNIGATVGKLWADAGHEILFSSRNPDKLRPLADAVGAQVGTPADAARFADVILLAINYGNNDDFIASMGDLLDGKIIIDATNPVGFTLPAGETAGTLMAKKLPNSTIIKAFNHVYFRMLESEAHRDGERLAIAVAGDDTQAKAQVISLVADAGFVGVDIGTLAQSAHLDPNGTLWTQALPEADMRQLTGV